MSRLANLVAGSSVAVAAVLLAAGASQARPAGAAGPPSTDAAEVALLDGEREDPSGFLLNGFGGNPVLGPGMAFAHTTATVFRGTGAFKLSTLAPIPEGEFGFVSLSLTGFGPSPAYVDTRDLERFDGISFWLRNETGSPFRLVLELKDGLDSNTQKAQQSFPIPAMPSWLQVTASFDLAPPWTIVGTAPDLERAKLVGFVVVADQGSPVAGSVFLDEISLVEPGGPEDPATAPIDDLLARITDRQLDGLWGSRDRATGLMPALSSFADVMATNVLAALVKLLPGAVERGAVSLAEADAYVDQVVETLDTILDGNGAGHDPLFVPPRYVDRVTLEPSFVLEESSVDAAFLYLALYQYRSLPTTSTGLRAKIGALLDRFDFAAFSSPSGWRLAYLYDTDSFTAGTYDGYSGEPWLISLAAHLSTTHHIDVRTQFHSGANRVADFLVDPARAHLVHSQVDFRAPFLQWLFPLFVDVAGRGPDTFPDPALSANAYDNAVRYQREAAAKAAQLGRPLFLQPDAGDDGSGAFYAQFSYYEDFAEPDLFMPWSVAQVFLADSVAGEAALREHLRRSFHGPLGLSDAVRWATGQPAPSRIAARHDFWNLSLSTLAFAQHLYGENQWLTTLPEVDAALDLVFHPILAPPVPDGPYLTSSELPGYRFKVRISAGTQVLAGNQEADCLGETLCVSGAVAGRSELFVRIIGPRPNGFLWVNLVRFTTSQLEVWAEQLATGSLNYYKLPALPREGTELTGLVDKEAYLEGEALGFAAEETFHSLPSPVTFTTPAFPDFRFTVRIFAGGTEQTANVETDCIDETVCVSGAVAGRSELFLRIIGPRPNGFLWVNLVRFTTSRVEVSAEQLSTGETRSYVLDAVPRESSQLPGLVDKEAFQP